MFRTTPFNCLRVARDIQNRDSTRFLLRALVLAVAFLPFSLQAGEQKLVKISTQKKDDKTEFFVENLQSADVTVTLELDVKNFNSDQGLPYTATIPAKAKVNVFNLSPANPQLDSSWSTRTTPRGGT